MIGNLTFIDFNHAEKVQLPFLILFSCFYVVVHKLVVYHSQLRRVMTRNGFKFFLLLIHLRLLLLNYNTQIIRELRRIWRPQRCKRFVFIFVR